MIAECWAMKRSTHALSPPKLSIIWSTLTSVAVLAEISQRSPQKLLFLLIEKYIHSIKVSGSELIKFWKKLHWRSPVNNHSESNRTFHNVCTAKLLYTERIGGGTDTIHSLHRRVRYIQGLPATHQYQEYKNRSMYVRVRHIEVCCI